MSSGHVPRLFVDTALAAGALVSLPRERAHHLHTVLRRKAGDTVCLFNGDGCEFPGRIHRIDKKAVEVELGEPGRPLRESPLQITLAQGLARGERMDYTIGKAVELGVKNIQLLYTRKVKNRLDDDRLNRKLLHWQKIATSAAEQAGRLIVPEIAAPRTLEDFLEQHPADHLGLVLDPEAERGLEDRTASSRISLLIGPEAGLDNAEIELAVARGFRRLRLGPRILRTETAGPAALAATQALWGDLRQ